MENLFISDVQAVLRMLCKHCIQRFDSKEATENFQYRIGPTLAFNANDPIEFKAPTGNDIYGTFIIANNISVNERILIALTSINLYEPLAIYLSCRFNLQNVNSKVPELGFLLDNKVNIVHPTVQTWLWLTAGMDTFKKGQLIAEFTTYYTIKNNYITLDSDCECLFPFEKVVLEPTLKIGFFSNQQIVLPESMKPKGAAKGDEQEEEEEEKKKQQQTTTQEVVNQPFAN